MEQIAPDVDPNMLYIGPRPFFILVLIQDIMHVMQFLFGIHINIYLQYRTVSTYLLYVFAYPGQFFVRAKLTRRPSTGQVAAGQR